MIGTTLSATRAMERMPPNITIPATSATAMPLTALGMENAESMASAMEFDCTAENTSPNEASRQTENTMPIKREPTPLAM